MNKLKNDSQGFTLLELLVVVLIIGILAAIALPQYRMVTLKAKYARAKQTASDIKKAYELYYTVHNEFPTTFSQLDFAHNFDDSTVMTTQNGYHCKIYPTYNQFYCAINENSDGQLLRYFVTYGSGGFYYSCRTTTDTSDIYNKICQQETGKTAEQASCKNNSGYCQYNY